MPHGRNPESDKRKRQIVLELQNRVGVLEKKFPNRPDWYLSAADKIEIFITDSKSHGGRRTWFDMANSDIKALASHPAGFIIFVLGYADNFLVVPAKDLAAQLRNYHGNLTEDGRYHFNLNKRGNEFEQLPNWDLHPYADSFEMIPKVIV
ncbi:MAG TPA: hypothetical protein VFV23_05320 [Verrucomicrobiae bacterium]|nr:hypothetical protein [Verrucomicrobiae bacterium]